MFRYSIPVALTWCTLIISSYMDIPLVKHYFDEYQAGIYSSASIIGKIGYFLFSEEYGKQIDTYFDLHILDLISEYLKKDKNSEQ